MSLEFYKLLHIIGIVLLTTGLVGVLTLRWSGQTLFGKVKTFSFVTHGLGLVLILVSGFGLLARLGLFSAIPVWAYIKILVWGLMALAISLLKRKGHLGWPLYLAILFLFIVAAYNGIFKT